MLGAILAFSTFGYLCASYLFLAIQNAVVLYQGVAYLLKSKQIEAQPIEMTKTSFQGIIATFLVQNRCTSF